MMVKFAMAFASPFNTHLCPKKFEVTQVRFYPKVAFDGSFVCNQVYKSVVKVDRVK
jgi:hypothetical protein